MLVEGLCLSDFRLRGPGSRLGCNTGTEPCYQMNMQIRQPECLSGDMGPSVYLWVYVCICVHTYRIYLHILDLT